MAGLPLITDEYYDYIHNLTEVVESKLTEKKPALKVKDLRELLRNSGVTIDTDTAMDVWYSCQEKGLLK